MLMYIYCMCRVRSRCFVNDSGDDDDNFSIVKVIF